MMELDISTLDNGIRLAKLSGKMDIQGVNQVGEELTSKIASAGIATIIDLSEVSFIASLGMRSLMTTARGVTNHGVKLVLLQPQSLVKEALSVAGITTLIPCYDSQDDAIAALNPANV